MSALTTERPKQSADRPWATAQSEHAVPWQLQRFLFNWLTGRFEVAQQLNWIYGREKPDGPLGWFTQGSPFLNPSGFPEYTYAEVDAFFGDAENEDECLAVLVHRDMEKRGLLNDRLSAKLTASPEVYPTITTEAVVKEVTADKERVEAFKKRASKRPNPQPKPKPLPVTSP